MIKNCSEIMEGYVCSSQKKTHSIRKGSERYTTCDTTVPPPLISVAMRGGWSMGKVFNFYFNFSECWDNNLGKNLTGLNLKATNIGNLTPYFDKEIDN